MATDIIDIAKKRKGKKDIIQYFKGRSPRTRRQDDQQLADILIINRKLAEGMEEYSYRLIQLEKQVRYLISKLETFKKGLDDS